MASRLRFTTTTVEATDQNWGFAQHRLRLDGIVAARLAGIGLDIGLRGTKNSHFCVYACELTPGKEQTSRWVALWITAYGVKANTLLGELRRRCELTEVSPASMDFATAVWPRPVVWQREGLDLKLLAPKVRW